jgi:large subunit ribosomal protein L21
MTMYAIFEAKGKQFRAEQDATLRLPTLDAEPGDRVTFDHVLLAQRDDDQVIVGQPTLEGAAVATEVICHGRGDKIVVFKMKRRKGYRRKQGHRQGFTDVRVVEIEFGTGASAEAPKPSAEKPAPKKKAAKPKPAAVEVVAAEVQPEVEAPAAEVVADVEINITDSARALAEEAGIDLATIEGTGKEGRILKSDALKAIKERDEA